MYYTRYADKFNPALTNVSSQVTESGFHPVVIGEHKNIIRPAHALEKG